MFNHDPKDTVSSPPSSITLPALLFGIRRVVLGRGPERIPWGTFLCPVLSIQVLHLEGRRVRREVSKENEPEGDCLEHEETTRARTGTVFRPAESHGLALASGMWDIEL